MRPTLAAELASIAFFAPLVIASRLQRMAFESWRPTTQGCRDMLLMAMEKPVAAISASLAFQAALLRNPAILPHSALAAAAAPVRRKVRANARRLGRTRR